MGKRPSLSAEQQRRTLLLVLLTAAIPALGAALIIALSSKPSIDDLTPAQSHLHGSVVLNWASLIRDAQHGLESGDLRSGIPVLALGYLDTYPAGLVLLPETGNLIHPAHRFGDQMIAVKTRADRPLHISAGTLVWASGTFHMLDGDPTAPQPLYRISEAEVKPATPADIARYFRRP